jgi:hypothetical protein
MVSVRGYSAQCITSAAITDFLNLETALFFVKQDLHFSIYFRRITVKVAAIPVLLQNTLRRNESIPAGTDYLQSEKL